MRLWYLRRAIPWVELAGCGTVAVLMTAAVQRWPSSAGTLVPYALAACAAAAGFLMDESASAVVRVTPRGGAWRVLARLVALALPIALWVALVRALPSDAGTDRPALTLAGVAGCLLAAGTSAFLSRAGVERPGTHVSAFLVGATTLPFVLGGFLGWEPIFPTQPVSGWVDRFWLALGLLGLLLAGLALRRTPRPRIRLRSPRSRPQLAPGRIGVAAEITSPHDPDRRVRTHRRR